MRRAILPVCLVMVFLLAGCDEVNNKAQDAIDAKDPSMCRQLSQENDVQQCYGKVADGLNDPNVCLQAAERNDCITYFATEKRNIRFCDLTTDVVAKSSCIVQVTGDNTGRAIDDIVADWRSKGALSKCKELCLPDYNACMGRHWQTYQAELAGCAKSGGGGSDRFFCEKDAEKQLNRNRLECYDEKDECEDGCRQDEPED